MGTDADKPFVDGFTALAVIVAIVTVIFTLGLPAVMACLAEDVPKGDANKKAYRGRLMRMLFFVLALAVLSWALAIMTAPGSMQILQALDLNPQHYDFIRSAWVVMDVVMAAVGVWTIRLAYLLQKDIGAAR
jgi:hypothetical protein